MTRGGKVYNMYFDFSFIREIRKREGLNIAVLSKRSGVSPAVISKLERNLCKAELDTIYRISRALGQTTSDFLSLAESASAHKKEEKKHKSDDFIFNEIQYGNIRCLVGKAEKGAKVYKPKMHKDNYELCWVMDGEIDFYLPGEKHELKSGEAIQFDAMLEHTYECTQDCQILIIHLLKDKRF
jgi:transcriptional regulator with XRE-family HTH domain